MNYKVSAQLGKHVQPGGEPICGFWWQQSEQSDVVTWAPAQGRCTNRLQLAATREVKGVRAGTMTSSIVVTASGRTLGHRLAQACPG